MCCFLCFLSPCYFLTAGMHQVLQLTSYVKTDLAMVKTMMPCDSHQVSWHVLMFIPQSLVELWRFIGVFTPCPVLICGKTNLADLAEDRTNQMLRRSISA